VDTTDLAARTGFDFDAFDRQLADADNPVAAFRDALTGAIEAQRTAFLAGTPASRLVPRHAAFIDAILTRAWRRQFEPADPDR
jgi:hypothetical protein